MTAREWIERHGGRWSEDLHEGDSMPVPTQYNNPNSLTQAYWERKQREDDRRLVQFQKRMNRVFRRDQL